MAILTISREYGSGGKEIGQAVAGNLGYDYVDKARILDDIKAFGTRWEGWAKELDEHSPTVWERYDWSFRSFGALIKSRILNYALRDRVVIMGRGGNFILKDVPHALRIRVVAPLEARIERIMKRETVDHDTAHWLIEKTDRERSGFIYALYGKHWDDPAGYDRVFDTGVQSIDEVTTIVKSLLQEKDQFNTEESRNALQMHSMAAEINTGIIMRFGFSLPTLDVFYDGRGLVLRGIIHNPKEHKRIEDEAKKLAGDLPLRCELHYRG
jgi:cytidylate kinase